jgi:hypothetical protein
MSEYFDIPEDFEENLGKYAPHLAKISRQNPFGVPEEYFSKNEQFIPPHIQLILNKKESGFTVPHGYFEALPEMIRDRIFLDGHQSLDVPEGYFEELPDLIQLKIFLDGLNKENPFTTPEHYFDGLAGKITARAKLEDLPKADTFDVPEGYFDALPGRLEERIAASRKPQTGIIALFRNNFSYVAAAASVALVTGLAIFFNRGGDAGVTGTGNTLAIHHNSVITKEDIRQYLCDNLDETAVMEIASAHLATGAVEVKTDNLDQKQVVDYLLDNNVDVNEL